MSFERAELIENEKELNKLINKIFNKQQEVIIVDIEYNTSRNVSFTVSTDRYTIIPEGLLIVDGKTMAVYVLQDNLITVFLMYLRKYLNKNREKLVFI